MKKKINATTVYDYKIGETRAGFIILTLIGAGKNKAKCFNDILSNISQSNVESLYNNALEKSQANSKKIIGNISEMFESFCLETDTTEFENFNSLLNAWKNFYLNKMPNAIDQATNKLFSEIKNITLQNIFDPLKIEWTDETTEYFRETSKAYISRIVFEQSSYGLYLEREILYNLSYHINENYFKDIKEESEGIDGWIGEIPFSVKPKSYRGNKIGDCVLAKYVKNGDDIQVVFHGDLPKEWIDKLINHKDNKSRSKKYKRIESNNDTILNDQRNSNDTTNNT